jgi:hypothetical protein
MFLKLTHPPALYRFLGLCCRANAQAPAARGRTGWSVGDELRCIYLGKRIYLGKHIYLGKRSNWNSNSSPHERSSMVNENIPPPVTGRRGREGALHVGARKKP